MTTPQTITIPTNAKRTVLGLEIEVVDNTEKREMDGTGLMRVGLRVRGPKGEFPVHLTSAKGETTKTVEGYTFEYLGGWRTEVELRVTPPPAP